MESEIKAFKDTGILALARIRSANLLGVLNRLKDELSRRVDTLHHFNRTTVKKEAWKTFSAL